MPDNYDAEKASNARQSIRFESLLKRLDQAECWRDETTAGTRVTTWKDLSPDDFEMTKEAVRLLLAALSRS